ncbi:cysteine proteinase inhibitor 5-like [Salvia divinorum]|uniref:Cysteine proteinase inhibitor 5-like n=1 Tax=Salvia divinorum TaxID=28513 RepID=A0ABD1GHQ6_SALDI
MASSMTMTASFFGGAVAAKPAAGTTRRSQLAVRASMDLEKAAEESSNTRRGLVLAGMAAAAASSVAKVAMADDAKKTLSSDDWTPIPNPAAPELDQIAMFAVSEYNKKEKKSLVYEFVFNGETQEDAGVRYRLLISVSDGQPRVNNFETVVYCQAKPTLVDLIYFEPR